MKFSIRLLYLYLFSFVGLIVVVIGSINLVNLGLRTYVFTEADKYEVYGPTEPKIAETTPSAGVVSTEAMQRQQERDLTRQRQRQFTDAIAMIVVGLPLYVYHWKTIKRESQEASAENKS